VTRYPKRRKLIGPADLVEGAQTALALARKTPGTKAALCGGLALQLYGSTRLTGDVDFVVNKMPRGFPRGEPLSFGGRETKAPNGVDLYLIVRDDKWSRLYKDALKAAVIDDEIMVPIVLPEFLAAMKMVAGRGKDELDLKFLVGVIDLDLARTIIERYLGDYAVDDFDRVVEETEWERKRR
jgi:hypothetical protein